MKQGKLHLKRAYDPPEESDGFRILVDRLWPRGLKKSDACLDAWMKEVTPTPALRKWFDHDPRKWESFGKAYREELAHAEGIGQLLVYLEQHEVVTLVYAAKDTAHTHALVLKEFLENERRK